MKQKACGTACSSLWDMGQSFDEAGAMEGGRAGLLKVSTELVNLGMSPWATW